MLGEITHLQAIVDDLTVLTEDPHKLPPASEQVTRAAPRRGAGNTSWVIVMHSIIQSRTQKKAGGIECMCQLRT